MLTAAIGRTYDFDAEDIVGSRDCRYPRLVLDDHGIASIINSCADLDAQSDLALEATCVLYPPLVCKITPDALGGVVIPVIQN